MIDTFGALGEEAQELLTIIAAKACENNRYAFEITDGGPAVWERKYRRKLVERISVSSVCKRDDVRGMQSKGNGRENKIVLRRAGEGCGH